VNGIDTSLRAPAARSTKRRPPGHRKRRRQVQAAYVLLACTVTDTKRRIECKTSLFRSRRIGTRENSAAIASGNALGANSRQPPF